jgi:hypothetical protein
MGMPIWNPDQAATVQAITAIAQGLLTVIALAVALGVPWWQQKQIRGEDKRRQKDELAGLRHALHTEVGMAARQCLVELEHWLQGDARLVPKNPRTARFPPLTIYRANADKIGLLTRNEIVHLMGFAGTMHDISVVADDMMQREFRGPEHREVIELLLSNACGSAARFFEVVPGIEGSAHDRPFIEKLRAAHKKMDAARIKAPPSPGL